VEYKDTPHFIKQIEGRTVIGFSGVLGNIDAGGDRTWRGAFAKTISEQAKRIKHLWQHQSSEPPTAVVLELREVGRADLPDDLKQRYPDATGALQVTREYLDTPRGNEILQGIAKGAITEMSFGYDPIKVDFEEHPQLKGTQIRNLREVRLYDTSDVNWGMNEATLASKVAVPYRDTGTADEGTAWSGPTLNDFTSDSWEDLSEGDKRRIAAHFAWCESMPPETYSGCKLPHHQAGASGVGKAVWRGAAAAMGALLGARGGVDIPDADRRAVYNHLSKHYAQFDKEPPDFKLIELARAAQGLDPAALKVGRVLSSANIEKLKRALDTLNEVLSAAEPEDEPEKVALLTASVLTRLRLAEREFCIVR